MGLFSSLFGSNDGSKAAARVAAANSAKISALAAQEIAARGTIADGLSDEMNYADEIDKSVVDNLTKWSGEDRERGETLFNDWEDNFRLVGDKYAKDAYDAGGEVDQNRAAGIAVSDVRRQYAVQNDANERAMQAMGVNVNSGRFAGSKRQADLAAMAAAAGGATKAKEDQRRWGIALRGDATKTGMGLLTPAAQFAANGAATASATADIADNSVARGLDVGNFKVAGYNNAINGLNGATNIQTSALKATDQTGLLPGLIGTGAAMYGAGLFTPKKV